MKAIRIHETGQLEIMQLEEIETLAPKAGEVLIKAAAGGQPNFSPYSVNALYNPNPTCSNIVQSSTN